MTVVRRLGTRTLAAALAAIVLFALVFYLGVYSPQSKKQSTAHAAHAAAESKISSLDSQVASLQALEKEIPSDKVKLAQYDNDIPDNPELPSVLDQIDTAAAAAGVDLSTVSPSSVPVRGASSSPSQSSSTELNGVPVLAMTLSATGNYGQLVSFLSALNSMERTLVVMGLSISGTDPDLSASLSADVFYAGQPTP